MRILLIGHGKMGRLIRELAPQYDGDVIGIVDPQLKDPLAGGLDDPRWSQADVAIDFTMPDAVMGKEK